MIRRKLQLLALTNILFLNIGSLLLKLHLYKLADNIIKQANINTKYISNYLGGK